MLRLLRHFISRNDLKRIVVKSDLGNGGVKEIWKNSVKKYPLFEQALEIERREFGDIRKFLKFLAGISKSCIFGSFASRQNEQNIKY